MFLPHAHRAGMLIEADFGRATLFETRAQSSGNPEDEIAIKTKPMVKKPSMYKVLMLNDDYTPMDFVLHVLEQFFEKSNEDAMTIMLSVHNTGVGICGVYTFEVAETKVGQVLALARKEQHPLQCKLEKA